MDHEQSVSENIAPRGMENLVVDSTSISWVDGQNGRLCYRGINIAELAAHSSFEEVAYLLLVGRLPRKAELAAFTWRLHKFSQTPEKVLRIIKELPRSATPLSILQLSLAALSSLDPQRRLEEESPLEKAMRIVAQTPVILAAAYRHHLGVPMVAPRSDLTHAENFYYMLSGVIPSKRLARVLELALIIQMDHGFNSSTFVARAVASTLTNMYAATSAAVGALSGPLHGGASEKVVEMLQEASAASDPAKYVRELLETGNRLMGMGHRVYKTTDPRALLFEDILKSLTPADEENADYTLLKKIEQEARNFFDEQGRPIFVNVDFWSGAVYKKLNIYPILYPAIFAAARIVGWTAHILELRQNNRLYRPKSQYTGPLNVPYVAVEER